jgi:hypothetical protein
MVRYYYLIFLGFLQRQFPECHFSYKARVNYQGLVRVFEKEKAEKKSN